MTRFLLVASLALVTLAVAAQPAAAEPPAQPTVRVIPGWSSAQMSWFISNSLPGGPEHGYRLRVVAPDGSIVYERVGSTTAFGAYEAFGPLENGVTYRFEVAAFNEDGYGPTGAADGTPFVPATFTPLAVYDMCPAWSIGNGNDFPVWFHWETNKAEGDMVAEAHDGPVIQPEGGKQLTVSVDGERHEKDDRC